ncbi:MAG: hypothetical protein AAF724_21115 [Pseudomonadota bacterium]
MTSPDNDNKSNEIAEWTKRRDALAEELKSFPFPADRHWLGELVIRHTTPLADAAKDLTDSISVNKTLADATAETDRHLQENIVNAAEHTDADVDHLRSSMRRCLAAMDAWIEHHAKKS